MRRLTNEEFDLKVSHLNISRLADYINTGTPINFECNVCKYKWRAAPHDLYKAKYGCPSCAGRPIIDNFEYDKKISHLNILRLDKYIHRGKRLNFLCLDCSNIWDAIAGSLYNAKKGCPKCGNKGGGRIRRSFENKQTILYYLYLEEYDLYKVGITTRTVKERYGGEFKKFKTQEEWIFKNGGDAWDIEQEFLKEKEEYIYTGDPLISGGNRELLTKNFVEELKIKVERTDR